MLKPRSLLFRISLLIISLVVIGVDQLSKAVVRSHLHIYEVKPVLKFWNWVLVYNQGSAFGFLSNQNGWQKFLLSGVALVVAGALIYYLVRGTYSLIVGIAFSFILGGALGNLIDRLQSGKVTDFIDWYVGNHHWPAFNLADSFISIGVALLIIESLFLSKTHS